MFKNAPKGEFTWEQDEAGDWDAFHDDRSEGHGWEKTASAMNMGRREDGTEWIEISTVDQDGNWDFDYEFTREDAENNPDFACWLCDACYHDDFFRGWAEYWLWCAEHGEDPLDQALSTAPELGSEEWVDFCLQAAEENLNYLRPKEEKVKGGKK